MVGNIANGPTICASGGVKRTSRLRALRSGNDPPNAKQLPRTATSPKSRGVNATANAFLHDQDPHATLAVTNGNALHCGFALKARSNTSAEAA
jgi:hypothetical protein